MSLRTLLLPLALAAAAFLPACSCSGNSLGNTCSTTTDCASGQVCVDGTCRTRGTADAVAPPPEGCVDDDSDGFPAGAMCDPGPTGTLDCDDSDATQHGRETCDGFDNDCDGVADNGVTSACGDCDPECRLEGRGIGTGTPFDLEADETDGVGLDDDGAIILDSSRVNTNFIWIANTPQGTVSRFDTSTFEEVGRYLTGPAAGGNDPSRTSVNSLGDVYVGNRNGNSVSRISVLGADCPDTNGDGAITTATDGTFLPFGSDDCVLWTTDLNAALPGERHIRAVAAQDVEGPDGELRQFVWIGGYDTNRVAKLDGETGAVLFTTPSTNQPYGFALDGEGNLWISTRQGNFLGRLDTNRCIDEASCADAVCDGEGGGDGCVKQRLNAPYMPYGVTVDFNQRVWLAGADVARYDPMAPAGSRWVRVNLPFGGIAVHGVAADAMGWVWGAAQGNGVVRIDADSPTTWQAVAGTTGFSNKGMAVDAEGKIWSVTQSDRAVVITPGPTIDAASVNTDVARSVVTPYTYSDMTGLQLRLATNPRGFYRHVFEGCAEGSAEGTDWTEVHWVAETPAGTNVMFRVKTSDDRATLDAAEWITVAMVPPDAPPASISSALMAAGVTPGRFLLLEVVLRADRRSFTEVITPRVLSLDVRHVCAPDFG